MVCEQCASLQAENAVLRHQLARALQVIRRQAYQLDQVRLVAWRVSQAAGRVLRPGTPRGTWALWKGRAQVAAAVLRVVQATWPS
jgi:hypothetical protein